MNDIDGDRGEWAPHDLVLWGGGKRVDDWVKGPKAACRCSSVECAADTNWKLESDYNSPGVLIKTSYFPHNQSTSQAFLSFGVVSWIPAAFFFFPFFFELQTESCVSFTNLKAVRQQYFSVPAAFERFVRPSFHFNDPKVCFPIKWCSCASAAGGWGWYLLKQQGCVV